jgi:hypothetical protein
VNSRGKRTQLRAEQRTEVKKAKLEAQRKMKDALARLKKSK